MFSFMLPPPHTHIFCPRKCFSFSLCLSQHTHPISGVLRLRKPLILRLMLLVVGLAAFCCCCCSSCCCCCNAICSCCCVSNICWNFKLPLLVSFSSHGSTNSSWERLWRHQKYATASNIRMKTIMPNVEITPINIMRPISATNKDNQKKIEKQKITERSIN